MRFEAVARTPICARELLALPMEGAPSASGGHRGDQMQVCGSSSGGWRSVYPCCYGTASAQKGLPHRKVEFTPSSWAKEQLCMHGKTYAHKTTDAVVKQLKVQQLLAINCIINNHFFDTKVRIVGRKSFVIFL